MKRYINLSMSPGNMAENEAGEWVQYSDFKEEYNKLSMVIEENSYGYDELKLKYDKLEEQNTENERIINSLYGSSDSKILEELKTVESDDAFKGGYKSRDSEIEKLRDAIIWAINNYSIVDRYRTVDTDGIFEYLRDVVEELNK